MYNFLQRCPYVAACQTHSFTVEKKKNSVKSRVHILCDGVAIQEADMFSSHGSLAVTRVMPWTFSTGAF